MGIRGKRVGGLTAAQFGSELDCEWARRAQNNNNNHR